MRPKIRLQAEVLYACTRKDALNDGAQIDVSSVARKPG